MSTNLIPLATQDALERAVSLEAIVRAQVAASTVRGLVVTDEVSAAQLADTVRTIKAGRAELDRQRIKLIQPLNDIIEWVRGKTRPIYTVLEGAENEAREANACYQLEKQRRAAEAETKRRAVLAAQAAALAKEAAALGEEAPPPMDPTPVPVSIRAAGGSGELLLRRTLMVEMLDPIAVAAHAPQLLRLDEAAAKALLRGSKVAVPDEGIVWHGIRAWQHVSSYSRGREND